MPINPESKDQGCRWGRLAIMGVALFAMAGLRPVNAKVRSTHGAINLISTNPIRELDIQTSCCVFLRQN